MFRKFAHITFFVSVFAILLPSCVKDDEAKVIPRGKLSKIYAEMLVTDQWITSTPGVRMIADTSLVYAPILEKYGYDLDDYLASIDVYMNDPERFSRILRKSGEIIELQIEDAERRLAELQRMALLPKIEMDFKPQEFFPYLFDEPYIHYYDSLTFEPDSLLQIYRLIQVERTDTVFEGLRMSVRLDSLIVADTLMRELPDIVTEEADSVAAEVAVNTDLQKVNDAPLKRVEGLKLERK